MDIGMTDIAAPAVGAISFEVFVIVSKMNQI